MSVLVGFVGYSGQVCCFVQVCRDGSRSGVGEARALSRLGLGSVYRPFVASSLCTADLRSSGLWWSLGWGLGCSCPETCICLRPAQGSRVGI